MKKTALLLMFLTILSKLLGFAREVTLSYFYGASSVSDAYLIAFTIPGTIFAFIGTALITSYIPLYSTISNRHGEGRAERFTSNLSNFVFGASVALIVLVWVGTKPIVKVFASGFTGNTLALAIKFTRITVLSVCFTALSYIFKGYLQVKGNFIAPALVGFPFNLIIIIATALSSRYSHIILPIGVVLAIVAQLLLMIPFVLKLGYRHQRLLDYRDKFIKQIMLLSLPVIIGTSVNQINVLVDRTIASRIAIGGISALNYANRLNGFVQGIFVLSIVTVVYPSMSRMVASDDLKSQKRLISSSVLSVVLFLVPATVGAMIFSEPIVRLLFGRGAFDQKAILMTSNALFFYSIGMIGFGLRQLLSRVFYSLQDTKTPMVNASLAIGMNIILNITLSRFLGVGGLALATSISALFCTALMLYSLRKKIGPLGLHKASISFAKILAASVAMAFISKIAYLGLLERTHPDISLLLAIGLGAVVYFGIILFMKIDEVDQMVLSLKQKGLIPRLIARWL